MENLRTRTQREISQAKDFAIQKFAKELLDAIDVLALALKSIPEPQRNDPDNPHLTSLYNGVSMTQRELSKTLARHGVEEIVAENIKFDPNLHQALFQIPVKGVEAGMVYSVEKKGYLLKGRVLRPAQVGVVKEE